MMSFSVMAFDWSFTGKVTSTNKIIYENYPVKANINDVEYSFSMEYLNKDSANICILGSECVEVSLGDTVVFKNYPLEVQLRYIRDPSWFSKARGHRAAVTINAVEGASKTSTLMEGEETTLTVNGKSYTISLNFIDSDSARFTINGKSTKLLNEGEKDEVGDILIRVIDMTVQNYQGGEKSVTFELTSIKGASYCYDSDGGMNSFVYGYTNFSEGAINVNTQDECEVILGYNSNGIPTSWKSTTSCSGNNCYLSEAYCKTDTQGNLMDADATELIPCPNGCRNGACIHPNASMELEEVTYAGVLEMLSSCTYDVVKLTEYPISCQEKCAKTGKVAIASFVIGRYRTKDDKVLSDSYSSYFMNTLDPTYEWSDIGFLIEELIEENLNGVSNSGDMNLVCQCCSAP